MAYGEGEQSMCEKGEPLTGGTAIMRPNRPTISDARRLELNVLAVKLARQVVEHAEPHERDLLMTMTINLFGCKQHG